MSPHESHDPITPLRVAQVLWRRKFVCLAVAVIVFLGGGAFLITRPHLYQSDSSVALLPVSNNAAVLPNYPNLITSLIPTYVQLASSPVLLNKAAAALPFHISANQLANDVHAESLSNAAVINIVGQSRNPVQAKEIATAATAAFLAQLHGNGVVVAQVYGSPTVPRKPASPKTKLLLGAVLALAICLGLGAGLVWDGLAGRWRDVEPSTAKTGRPPVLGIVRESWKEYGVSSIGGPAAKAARAGWRSLRTNFLYAALGQQMQSVTVMSPRREAGKSIVAASLAAAIAELGMTVILVDADVHHPRLHDVFGLDNGDGLTSAILNGTDLATLLRPVPYIPGLQVITAGPPLPEQDNEVTVYRDQLPTLTSLADLVVVNGPAFQDRLDAASVAALTDGVVLVAHAGMLAWRQVEACMYDLASAGARVIGTALTGVSGPADSGQPGKVPTPGSARNTVQPTAWTSPH